MCPDDQCLLTCSGAPLVCVTRHADRLLLRNTHGTCVTNFIHNANIVRLALKDTGSLLHEHLQKWDRLGGRVVRGQPPERHNRDRIPAFSVGHFPGRQTCNLKTGTLVAILPDALVCCCCCCFVLVFWVVFFFLGGGVIKVGVSGWLSGLAF